LTIIGQSAKVKLTMCINETNTTRIDNVLFGASPMPPIIAGPCVIESESHAIEMAFLLKKIVQNEGFPFVYKSSYDKANRSSIHAFRGPGVQTGLRILQKVRQTASVPILTDIHSADQIEKAADIVDIIQIPAFLCRQTDLYVEAGKRNIAVNVKKGQFMSPESMVNVVEKARECGIQKLTLTERGTSFGYHRLVVDFAGLEMMKTLGVPVIFDGTHAVQQPAGCSNHTGGNRSYVPALCRAAAATGIHGFFLEVHESPDSAPCDGPNMITPDTLKNLLRDIRTIISGLKVSNDAES
jgi:2-dehydro-3-deoxyphosphooctonate aldolase (KDO 8-P synthase)